jgi:hypothetical protein
MNLELEPFISGNHYLANQVFSDLRETARPMFAAARDALARLENDTDHYAFARQLRSSLLRAVGGLPKRRRVKAFTETERLELDGITIRKICFESLPGFHVPALLYEPAPAPSHGPAVLFACGHGVSGKAYPPYQRVCRELAANGFTVLAPDPVSQGERCQLYNPRSGNAGAGRSVMEHTQMAWPLALLGENLARYIINDLMAAVDILTSLPTVDPKKIGMTGSGGGGLQTAYMMVCDDRIRAAAPCTYITERELFLRTGQAADGEQNIHGMFSMGLNHADMIVAFAPRPVLVGAARYDFFPLKGTMETVQQARRCVRRVVGKAAAETINLVVGEHGHMYSAELRGEAVRFFRRHLAEDASPYQPRSDRDIPVVGESRLFVCDDGQAVSAFRREKTIFDFARESLKGLKSKRPKLTPRRLAAVLAIDDRWGKRSPTYPIVRRKEGFLQEHDLHAEEVQFYSDDRTVLNGLFYRSASAGADRLPLSLVVPADGLDGASRYLGTVRHQLRLGRCVFVGELRGTGMGKNADLLPMDRLDPLSTEYVLNINYDNAGKCLMGRRVYDIIRMADYVEERTDTLPRGSAIYADGPAAMAALFAAGLDERITSGVLTGMPPRLDAFLDTPDYEVVSPYRYMIYGCLKTVDLPDILAMLPDDTFTIRDSLVW